ncbi:MAG: leucine--tRNA ligase [Candidatus Fermentibacteraceae bacterium]|nr:leucine--tRNA ligase [Candidatus Fermentibacteraceae bacterium]
MSTYNFKELEKKWSPFWEELNLYKTGDDPEKSNFYCLDYFPYPSGAGLSVGHCRNYIPTDVICRKKKMDGHNVLHPMGWDAFGQPAEEYAIKTGMHPAEVTRINTENYKRQMKLFEAGYDWSREINSSHPDYYRWTQYFFLLLFDRGLAYQSDNYQMYCPSCKIVLSNEESAGGVCWRCNGEVVKKKLPQWYFKITDYADRLLDELDDLDWPENIKAMQRNWIGRSHGAEVVFSVDTEKNGTIDLPVYTTRIDTIFGATFCVLAPEHPELLNIVTDQYRDDVERYIKTSSSKTDLQRLVASEKEKTGIFTGAWAVNPFNGEKIPVWTADYVLSGYGTAAIMAVPAHDERDHAFAKKYGLSVVEVVAPGGVAQGVEDAATVADGELINSGQFTGLSSVDSRKVMADYAVQNGFGKAETRYRIRDWLVSRQRYWGAPIPIVHCDKCGAVPDRNLPVVLPDVESYEPDDSGRSPLAAQEAWVNTSCPRCGAPAKRETSTMAGFACSSWYFLRFVSPHFSEAPFDPEEVKKWLPVDLYVGGAEHAVMHLIYARFWTKVMYDAGMLDFTEPFTSLKNQGMLISYDHQKMSKSKGNVITPDDMVVKYGADALRLYIVFMGPFEAEIEWSEEGLAGTYRFVKRVWNLFLETAEPEDAEIDEAFDRELRYELARTVKKVTEDIDGFQFNTGVAAMMEFLNFLSVNRGKASSAKGTWRKVQKDFLAVLAPVAPFVSEELWHVLGFPGETVHTEPWPQWSSQDLVKNSVEIVVQIKGKIRDRISVPAGASKQQIEEIALGRDKIKEYLNGAVPRRVIVVPGRLVNIIG